MTHDEQCEGYNCKCFKRKLQTVQFGNVTPPPDRLVEQRMEKDLPAYARLRANGLQPKTTRGCAELEGRANTQFEIEMSKLVDPPLMKRYGNVIAESMQACRDLEFTTADVKEWKNAAKDT